MGITRIARVVWVVWISRRRRRWWITWRRWITRRRWVIRRRRRRRRRILLGRIGGRVRVSWIIRVARISGWRVIRWEEQHNRADESGIGTGRGATLTEAFSRESGRGPLRAGSGRARHGDRGQHGKAAPARGQPASIFHDWTSSIRHPPVPSWRTIGQTILKGQGGGNANIRRCLASRLAAQTRKSRPFGGESASWPKQGVVPVRAVPALSAVIVPAPANSAQTPVPAQAARPNWNLGSCAALAASHLDFTSLSCASRRPCRAYQVRQP